jgi:hypothetical protein
MRVCVCTLLCAEYIAPKECAYIFRYGSGSKEPFSKRLSLKEKTFLENNPFKDDYIWKC